MTRLKTAGRGVFTHLRRERKLSQEAASRLVGVSLQSWRNWESGRAAPSLLGVAALAKTFGPELDKLRPEWYLRFVEGRAALG